MGYEDKEESTVETRLLVVKIGGAQGIDLAAVCKDIAAMEKKGFRLVLAHGGSERTSRLAAEMGHPARFLHSPSGYVSRYTDRKTRDIYVEAVKAINGEIVHQLSKFGVHAVGLTTPDSCVLLGERKRAIRAVFDGRVRVIRDDYSGYPVKVRHKFLAKVMDLGQVPVVPPLALSLEDGFLNIDGDRVAATISGALSADIMVLLSNVRGLYRHYPDHASLVHEIPRSQLDLAMSWAQGRMKRKIRSVQEALDLGVPRAAIADGRGPQPLKNALAGGGTWFV